MERRWALIFIFYFAVFEQHGIYHDSVIWGAHFKDKFEDRRQGNQADPDEKKYIAVELLLRMINARAKSP